MGLMQRERREGVGDHEMENSSYTEDFFEYDNLVASLAVGGNNSNYKKTIHGYDLEVERVANSSVVKVRKVKGNNTNSTNKDSNDGEIRLIHLACAFDYSNKLPPPADPVIWDFLMASSKAALMAAYDFNQGQSKLVPQLATLKQEPSRNCSNLRITLDFYDTEQKPRVGATVLLREIHSRPFPYQVTAVIGGIRSAVSIPMAILNTVKGIPQISPSSTSTALDSRSTYSLFGRVLPSSQGDAEAALDFFVKRCGTTHLAILYITDEYGSSYRRSLENAAAHAGVITKSVGINFDATAPNDNVTDGVLSPTRGSLAWAVDALLETGFQHFAAVIVEQHFKALLDYGVPRGLMGPRQVWIFGDSIAPESIARLRFPRNSPQAKALRGLGLLSVGSESVGGSFQRFLDEYHRVESLPEFQAYFRSKSPVSDVFSFANYSMLTTTVGPDPPLAYDAVMAVGLAACQTPSEFFTGRELFAQFLKVDYDGASGPIVIDPETGSRSYDRTTYVLRNTRLMSSLSLTSNETSDDGMVAVDCASALEYGMKQGQTVARWFDTVEGGFVFADGTRTPPLPLPGLTQVNQSYSQELQIFFSVLGALLMLMATGFGVWTWRNRKSYVVKASQPEFLLVICIGVFFMAFSIILRDSTNPPQSYALANFSCMANYWFFFSGFGLAFSALFAKTWRIVKILGKDVKRFHRIVVSPRDVLSPVLLCVAGNLLIVAIWQAVDPLQFERLDYVHGPVDRFARYTESIGECTTEEGTYKVFVGVLLSLNGCMIIAANVMAYRARHIKMEFSESSYIAIAMFIILQVLILALPVFIFDTGQNVARVATQVLVLVVASSILSLVFIPKIAFWFRYKKLEIEREERRKNRVAAVLQNQEGSGRVESGGQSSCSDEELKSRLNEACVKESREDKSSENESNEKESSQATVASEDRRKAVRFSTTAEELSGRESNSEHGLDGTDSRASGLRVLIEFDVKSFRRRENFVPAQHDETVPEEAPPIRQIDSL